MEKETLKSLLKKHNKNIEDLVNHLQITRQGLDDKIKKKRFKDLEVASIAAFLDEDVKLISKTLGLDNDIVFENNFVTTKTSNTLPKTENNQFWEFANQLKNLNEFYQRQLDKKDEQIIFYQRTIDSLMGKQLVSGEPPLDDMKLETKVIKLVPDYRFDFGRFKSA